MKALIDKKEVVRIANEIMQGYIGLSGCRFEVDVEPIEEEKKCLEENCRICQPPQKIEELNGHSDWDDLVNRVNEIIRHLNKQ